MKVLVAPLNWGLGHAARSAAIIDILLEAAVQVSVASDGQALAFLHQHYGNRIQRYISLPSYPVVYDESSVALAVIKRSFGLLKAIHEEAKVLSEAAQKEKWNIILSDNRFGAYDSAIPSVFISHQFNLKTSWPLIDPLATAINRVLIRKFDQYWIPDYEGHLLSGELSHANKQTHFIGPLHKKEQQVEINFQQKQVVVLSGPEPRRTIWEQRLLEQLENIEYPTLFVRGLPLNTDLPDVGNDKIEIVNFLSKKVLNAAISQAEIVVARAGYSTIMDLVALRKPAILIPTPGQTEQEYLAQHISGQWPITFFSEEDFQMSMTRQVLYKLKNNAYPKWDNSKQSEKILRLIRSLCD